MSTTHKLAMIGAMLGGCVLVSSVAFAADPASGAAAGKDRWGLDANAPREVREQKMREFSAKFEAEKVANQKKVGVSPSLLPQSYTEAKEVSAIVERLMDSDSEALISMPYAKELEPNLVKVFTKVTKKEAVGDMTLFNGRVYRQMRITAHAEDFPRFVGKEALVSIRSANIGGAELVAVRAPSSR